MRWYLILLFPSVQSYLFGCYYDYHQPLVLPEQLPIGACTHVLLIGAVIVKDLGVNVIQHPYNGLNALQSMRDYRTRDSNKLKIIPSVLGDDAEWKAAIQDPESQRKIIIALVEFAKSQNVDGIVFDCEYPCGDYKSLYTKFIKELRAIVQKTFGEEFLLTTAVGASKNTIDNCYEIGIIIIVTIYDKQTGYSSSIYSKSIEQGEARYYNTEWSAAYLVEQGVLRNKILIGLEGLGHTFDQWTNVGDVRAAEEKALFVKKNGYGAAFTFGLHLDDPTDVCHHGENFPIHRTVARHLH